MIVQFKNSQGVHRECKVGFSWTIFFFGGFPFLFRGMALHGALFIVAGFFTAGISNLIICFIGNKMTAKYYLENGYARTGDNWDYANRKWGLSPG